MHPAQLTLYVVWRSGFEPWAPHGSTIHQEYQGKHSQAVEWSSSSAVSPSLHASDIERKTDGGGKKIKRKKSLPGAAEPCKREALIGKKKSNYLI